MAFTSGIDINIAFDYHNIELQCDDGSVLTMTLYKKPGIEAVSG